MFQFTRPRGARHPRVKSRVTDERFQFTRPRGARRARGRRTSTRRKFQFTRPRGARHLRARVCVRLGVSIHAPTGGATSLGRRHGEAPQFQFTRPRGARRGRVQSATGKRGFNSRAHGGRDIVLVSANGKQAKFQFTRPRGARPEDGRPSPAPTVSIHAPTGGATAVNPVDEQSALFQFTRPRGARLRATVDASREERFQFTRPRGARRGKGEATVATPVSIHAPTGGATSERDPGCGQRVVSIHAPTGGATGCGSQSNNVRRFNSRAHGGRDTQ